MANERVLEPVEEGDDGDDLTILQDGKDVLEEFKEKLRYSWTWRPTFHTQSIWFNVT